MDIIGKFVSMKKWKTSCMKKWYSREKITIPTIIFFLELQIYSFQILYHHLLFEMSKS
jgi:hypothetical protein